MLVPPVSGWLSDRLRRQAVGRRPFVLVGTAVNVLGLLWAAGATSLTGLTAGFLVAVFGQQVAGASYSAMIPEVVPPGRWGHASGHMGVATLLGSVAGIATAGLLPAGTAYALMMATSAGGALVTAAGVGERPGGEPVELPHVTVRSWRRFGWIFSARFFVLFAQTLLMTFVLYFFQEVLHVTHPAAGTALVAGLALCGAAVSAYVAGRLSDRVDRTLVVAAAGVPMAAAVTGFALFPTPGLVYGLGVLWGLGYGAFLSVDWALALDTIPDLANVARDLGVWGIASNLPSVVAPIVGGVILARFLPPAQGYRILFLTAGGAFALGSLLVLAGRRAHLGSGIGRLALSFLIAGILRAYVGVAYRVRLTGQLPVDRSGLLVIANHQHDLEGMVVPVALFLRAAWRGRVFSAGSNRLFEPGFLAGRGPRWLGRWFGGLNLSPILDALGVLPVENMPLSRPLMSWAYAIYRRHGDLPAAEVLSRRGLSLAGPSVHRLSDLWRRVGWPQEGPLCPITVLRDPYRTEVRTSLRRDIDGQMRRLARALDDGGTLYLTPEGQMTASGQIGRMRAALGALVPHARTVWLCAVSYDPWISRRLTMVARLVPPARNGDLVGSLLAARPITLSQVVARALLDAPDGLSEAELRDRLEAARRLAPEGAEWPADSARPLRATLARMRARGAAELCDGRWRAGPRRHDERFGHVPDLVAAQAAQFSETVRALAALRQAAAAPSTAPPLPALRSTAAPPAPPPTEDPVGADAAPPA
jgi:MFS family permease